MEHWKGFCFGGNYYASDTPHTQLLLKQHWVFELLSLSVYRIARKFGGDLNLDVWWSAFQLPN